MTPPWIASAPDVGEWLPGGGVALEARPLPRWPIAHRNIRALHAALTGIVGGHDPNRPLFSLFPWPGGLRWGVYSQDELLLRLLSGRDVPVSLYERPTLLRGGPVLRVRAPRVGPPGRRRLRVDTITPVCIKTMGGKITRQRPTNDTMRRPLEGWLAKRIGLELPAGSAPVSVVDDMTRPTEVPLGGKFRLVPAWHGTVVLETNAVGHWLLEVGARIGFGARTAYGFGRIRVVPWG